MCPPSRSQILVERRNSCLPTKVCTATSWVMSKVSDTFATLSGHAALPPILGNLMLGQVDGAESRFLDVVDPARSRVGILLALHYGFVVHCWFCLLRLSVGLGLSCVVVSCFDPITQRQSKGSGDAGHALSLYDRSDRLLDISRTCRLFNTRERFSRCAAAPAPQAPWCSGRSDGSRPLPWPDRAGQKHCCWQIPVCAVSKVAQITPRGQLYCWPKGRL